MINRTGLALVCAIVMGCSLFGAPLPSNQPTGAPTASPSAGPTQSATASASPSGASTAAPTVAATATAAPSATAGPSGTPTAETLLVDVPGVAQAIGEISNGTLQIPAQVPFFGDGLGDLYLPQDGSPSAQDWPWIDITGTAAFRQSLGRAQTLALSERVCGSQTDTKIGAYRTLCNQGGPMPAGEYIIFVSTYAAPMPDPFPEPAQCVLVHQVDLDQDRETGFQSNLPFNHLIGADTYWEDLFFWSEAGDFEPYLLATDHSLPPRSDTGEIHGNLGTQSRTFYWQSVREAIAVLVAEDSGDLIAAEFSAGGFCNGDRAEPSPDNFAVDALGSTGESPFPEGFSIFGDEPL